MRKFSIAQVEALTGIQAHTLRVWERRYDFIQAERTDTNIRYYTNEQLKKLLNLSILLRNGYKVSSFNNLRDDQINDLVEGILAEQTSEEDNIQSLIMATIDMKEEVFSDIFDKNVDRFGILETITRIIYPFMGQVGILWGIDQVMPAQEHFVSNLIKLKLCAAIEALPIPKEPKGTMVLCLTEGEEHELGLLTTYFLLKSHGWKVFYLGQSVPLHDMEQTCSMVEPDFLFTFFVTPRKTPIPEVLDVVHKTTRTPILVSGSQYHFKDLKLPNGVTYLRTPSDFEEFLENYLATKNS